MTNFLRFICLMWLLPTWWSCGTLKVNIRKGLEDPLPIHFVTGGMNLDGKHHVLRKKQDVLNLKENLALNNAAWQMAAVSVEDLGKCGLFRASIRPESEKNHTHSHDIQSAVGVFQHFNAEKWRGTNNHSTYSSVGFAQGPSWVCVVALSPCHDGKTATATSSAREGCLFLCVRVYNVQDGALLGQSFERFHPKLWRHVAHKISSFVYTLWTGHEGPFHHQIVAAYNAQRFKTRIVSMDMDGHNMRFLSSGLVSNAHKAQDTGCAASAGGRFVSYVQRIDRSYAKGRLARIEFRGHQNDLDYTSHHDDIVSHDAVTPDTSLLGASSVLDDGAVVFSASRGNEHGLYIWDPKTSYVRPIKGCVSRRDRDIDVSASFYASKEGRVMVWNSNRLHRNPSRAPKIYKALLSNIEDSITLVTSQSGKYYAPRVSSSGHYIAAVKFIKGRCYLVIIDNRTHKETLVAESFLMDSPSWVPGDHYVVFASQRRQGAPSELYMMDMHTRRIWRISKPGVSAIYPSVLKRPALKIEHIS